MQLWAHTLVKNEDRYLWYSATSVIDYVDKMLLWDTGSSDNTTKIIKRLLELYPSKINYRQMGEVNPDQFTTVRQKMLEESKCDWVIVVDGDEVWWGGKIREIKNVVNSRGKELDSIVSRYYNIVGDIYHFQDESAGRYSIDGRVGNLNIRAFNRNIPGLKFTKPHGQQGIVDGKGVLLQERDHKMKYWQNGYAYLHFTNMRRSGERANDLKVPKRDFKLKFELGTNLPNDFYYPESFFADRPDVVSNIWQKMTYKYLMKSLILTPIKLIKRRLLTGRKSGY